jgi:Protein of unknown function (DUF3987)
MIPKAEQRHTTSAADGEARYGVTALRQFPTKERVPHFPTDVLPRPAARLVTEAAAAIGCPPDAIGLSALATLGSAIGNSRVIQPKKGWTEGAAIYGAVIAESGEKKTAAIATATDVVQRLENKLGKEHEEALDEFAAEERQYEVERKDAARQSLPAPPPPRRPVAERVHVNDTTVEALILILKENPRGILVERDELVGWVKAMDQYKAGGKGADRQFFLSTWSNRPVSVDRKGQQGPISTISPFASVIGSIQPDVLPELAENREDGMLERILFAYPRTLNAMWTEDDIGEGALVAYRELYHRLRGLHLETDEFGDPVKVPVVFSPEAKEVYIDVYNEHRREMALPGFPRYLRSVWAKLEAYTLRLTLIIACCRFTEDGVAERVESDDVLRAVALTDYFKDQARRVFGALRGYDEKKRLLEDISRFVAKGGGLWIGTATELHQQFQSDYKPQRAEELSKFIKEAAEDEEDFTYDSKIERYKDEASGEWKSKREITLYRQTP